MSEKENAAALSIGGLLGMAEGLLTQQRVASPRRVAEMLMAHVLGMERYRVRMNVRAPLGGEQGDQFLELVRRRMKGEPVQYLVGSAEFMSLPFRVSPAVLIPRPETEVLVEAASAILGNSGGVGAKARLQRASGMPGRARSPVEALALETAAGGRGSTGNGAGGDDRKILSLLTILDLGTGSGAIALSLAHYLPRVLIYATDTSPEALALARENAKALRLDARVRFLEGDLFGALAGRELDESFAAVVANPPYIPTAEIAELPREVRDYEPRVALDGGPDGLDVVRRITAEAPRWLRRGGLIAFEVGAGQAPRALGLLREQAIWKNARVVPDYTGIDRVVIAERGGG